jgi:methanogenic corrinoid protein MtbC1
LTPQAVAEIRARVLRRDISGAQHLLHAARNNSTSTEEFVARVAVPLQQAIGMLWERNEVDQDAVVETSLLVKSAFAPSTGTPSRGRAHPPVGIACPAGEWHELPGRMLAAVLHEHGWTAVTHLGASTPAARLEQYIARERPVAIVCSCTLPTQLVDATETIGIARRAGVPVIAGGAAMGSTDRRARALGADAWCGSVHELVRTLETWERHGSPGAGPEPGDVACTKETRARILDGALRVLARQRASDREALESTSARLAGLLQLTEAAVMTDDETVLTDTLAWWHDILGSRGRDANALVMPLLDALTQAVEPGPMRSVLLGARATFAPVRQGSPMSGDGRMATG